MGNHCEHGNWPMSVGRARHRRGPDATVSSDPQRAGRAGLRPPLAVGFCQRRLGHHTLPPASCSAGRHHAGLMAVGPAPINCPKRQRRLRSTRSCTGRVRVASAFAGSYLAGMRPLSSGISVWWAGVGAQFCQVQLDPGGRMVTSALLVGGPQLIVYLRYTNTGK